MSWVRLDDGFYDNGKVLRAGDAAIGLYCRMLTYAARHLTDGFVPAEVVSLHGEERSITRLVEVGLWEEVEGGYTVPGFLDYNRSRAEVEEERAAARERMRGLRARRGRKKAQGGSEHEVY